MAETTLGVSKEFRKEVRKYDGRNDEERLRNWAKNQSDEETGRSDEEIKKLAEERFFELQRSI